MCGRFNIIDDAATRALLESLNLRVRLPQKINIAPTEAVPVIIREGDAHHVHEMRWWLTPSWAPEVSNQYAMFNARSENLESSRAFRGPYKHHRGIIPASSFIEWRKTQQGAKQPYLIEPEEGCFAFAGLWDVWQKQGNYLESCTIVTTEAVAGLRWLHHRMPLLLMSEDIPVWLDPAASKQALDEIRSRTVDLDFNAYPVSDALNNSRIKDPELLTPREEPIEIKH